MNGEFNLGDIAHSESNHFLWYKPTSPLRIRRAHIREQYLSTKLFSNLTNKPNGQII